MKVVYYEHVDDSQQRRYYIGQFQIAYVKVNKDSYFCSANLWPGASPKGDLFKSEKALHDFIMERLGG